MTTFNWKAAKEAYLRGEHNDLEAIRAHIPTAADVAKMDEKERYWMRGPEADLDKCERAPADGAITFDHAKKALAELGYEFFGPGEHPLPTRFAVKKPDAEFTGRSMIRDLFQAMDFVNSAWALRR
jgi:hypothetical protein